MDRKVVLQFKKLGRKKVETVELTLEKWPKTLRELIEACVAQEVGRFNDSRERPHLASFLSPGEIQEQSEKGKIAFGDVANSRKADLGQALSVAFQAFEDGLYSVFVDGDEVRDLGDRLALQPGSEIMFIRLTFLSGW